MNKKSLIIMMAAGVALCIGVPILADYHYASHTGSNEYPYTSWETASDSITNAMLAADPFDTIYIAAGEYNEIIHAPQEDTCLTFIGAGIDSTIVWQDSVPNLWLARNNTLVEHICFQTEGNRSLFGGYIGTSIAAKRCKFVGGIAILAGGGPTVVENCEFNDVREALNLLLTRPLVFRNNYFSSNIATTIFLGGWSFGLLENNIFIVDIYQLNNSFFSETFYDTDSLIFKNNYIDNMLKGHDINRPLHAEVANNTVRRIYQHNSSHLDRAFSCYQRGDSINVEFRNNAITESGYGIYARLEDYPDNHLGVYYTGFWGNVYDDMNVDLWDPVDTAYNINAFPMYAQPDSWDVHLQAFSPFIDAGDPNILDVDGSRSDIGVFGGPGGSSYEYQDLAPRIPDSLWGRFWNDSVFIGWRLNYEADFNEYEVYRDTVPNFEPSVFNLVAIYDSCIFFEPRLPASAHYYKIAAVDNQDNVSDYSAELAVFLTGVDNYDGVETPKITAIENNYPNPFNSSTTIVYTVANLGPIPAQINIDIYDVLGQKVRTLLDTKQEVGRHMINWDGKDDFGNELSTGIYFAKITQWHVDYLSRSQKLILMK